MSIPDSSATIERIRERGYFYCPFCGEIRQLNQECPNRCRFERLFPMVRDQVCAEIKAEVRAEMRAAWGPGAGPHYDVSHGRPQCCDKVPEGSVFWNRFNGCVQCHACGQMYLPALSVVLADTEMGGLHQTVDADLPLRVEADGG